MRLAKVVISICLIIMFLVLLLAAACKPAPPTQLPEQFVWTSLKMGSSGHSASVGLGEAVRKNIGVPVKVIPDDTDIGGWVPVLTGKASATFRATSASYAYSAGIGPVFGLPEWGPQRVRMIWGMPLVVTFGTTKDTGITSWNDMRGKRLPDYGGWASGVISLKAMMAAFNIKPEEVTWVPIAGYSAGIESLDEGRIDVTSIAPYASFAYELDANKGIVWLEAPKDPEAIARLLSVAPYFTPMWWDFEGAGGLTPDKPFWGTGMPYMLMTHERLESNIAYLITKGIWEGYDVYKDMHPILKTATHEAMLDYTRMFDPYHEGTIRYLKEIGVWTAEHERYQQEKLALEEKRIAAWEEAAELAKAQGLELDDPAWYDEESGFCIEYLKAEGVISIPSIEYHEYSK